MCASSTSNSSRSTGFPGLTEPGYPVAYAFVQYGAGTGDCYMRGSVKNLTDSLYRTDGLEFSSVGNI
jgi:iron complex outermembrane receptor protein